MVAASARFAARVGPDGMARNQTSWLWGVTFMKGIPSAHAGTYNHRQFQWIRRMRFFGTVSAWRSVCPQKTPKWKAASIRTNRKESLRIFQAVTARIAVPGKIGAKPKILIFSRTGASKEGAGKKEDIYGIWRCEYKLAIRSTRGSQFSILQSFAPNSW